MYIYYICKYYRRITMSKLNNYDYIKILEYYKKPIPKTYQLIKISAEEIIGQKLCRCIKKIGLPEERSIGICTKTIINSKGYTRGKFKCKNNSYINLKKKRKNKTIKIKR